MRPPSLIRPPSEEDTRRQLEGAVEVVEAALARYTALERCLSGRRWKRTLTANVTANVLRNLWAYVVIFCGHFPDGAEKFSPDVLESETRGDWYLRQILGTINVILLPQQWRVPLATDASFDEAGNLKDATAHNMVREVGASLARFLERLPP